MLRNKILFIVGIICISLFAVSCSNQKNTKKSRIYHEINTRYNIYYNAEIAYNEALEAKNKAYQDNLSEMIYMYPTYPEDQKTLGGFETTIDKATKAIKLHSIQAKPERDPKKRRDIKYQEWLQQKEFNPFLKNVWLLMAKAEYQSLDYIRAVSTLSYITRLFKNDKEVVTEANLWMGKAYLQMGWLYEAENILHKIKLNGDIPKSQQKLYSEVYANFLLKSGKYEEAIPYLKETIENTGGIESIRLKYLLGQIYEKLGNTQAAYDAFDGVQGLSTPYLYSLNSQLQQAKFVNPDDAEARKKTLSSLKSMTGKQKNEEYLDQIYYAIGNIHWGIKDTTNTIENYKLAIEKSTRGGYDKGLVLVALGDIYFDKKDYVKAQPLYPEALGVLGKKFPRYDELTKRSEALDELAVYAEALHLQDSLQTLARMSEDERLLAINKLIELEKIKDKEAEKDRAREEWKASNPDEERPDMTAGFRPPGATSGSTPSFYFYNTQTVAQGKASFKKLWGNRKLEDNWRRKDRAINAFDDFLADNSMENDTIATDSTGVAVDQEMIEKMNDKYSPEFYLAQIPLTPQALLESNIIVEDAYFQMGQIYKNKLEDLNLSIEAFTTNLNRFPGWSNQEEIYYQLFLIYSQLNNKSMADLYRNKLLTEYPEGDYAITLSDPNYEWNLRNISQIENELYNATYNAYLTSKVAEVRQNYIQAKEKYPLTSLMPKFMFLNALTYAQTNDPKQFGESLKELIEKYPDSDVIPVASEMLKDIQRGRSLVAGGPMRGMIWDIQFTGGDFSNIDTTLTFVDEPKSAHRVLLVFNPEKINKNELIYDVANHNFSNFIVKTFDLSFTELPPLQMLQIQGFNSFNEVSEYVQKAFEDSLLISKIDPSIIMVPISEDNYKTLNRGQSLGNYFDFFSETYGKQLPKLVEYWKEQRTGAEEETEENAQKEKNSDKVESIPEKTIEKETEIDEEDIAPIEMLPKKPRKEDVEDEEVEDKPEGVETIITDETVNKIGQGVSDVNQSINEILDNPVDGIKNVFNKVKNRPKLTKEEKEELKKQKALQKAIDKERRQKERAALDSIRNAERHQQDSLRNAKKEAAAMEREIERAKEDARKAAIKEKEDARKARQQELREKEKAQQNRLKEKERDRKMRQKQREQEQKEKLRQRQKELNEKRRQRQQQLKEKERQARERARNR